MVIVSRWRFDEGAGATVEDDMGVNDGTITNATRVVGRYANALSFNGSTSYVSIPDNNSLDLTELTLVFWLNPSNLTGYHGILSKSLGASRNYSVRSYDAVIDVDFHDTSDVRHVLRTSTSILLLNTWQQLIITIKNNACKVYHNLIEKNYTWIVGTGVGTPKVNGDALYLGESVSGFYAGLLDDVRVYNGVLTNAERTALYWIIPADLTTVTSTDVAVGKTFYGASGDMETGTAVASTAGSGHGRTLIKYVDREVIKEVPVPTKKEKIALQLCGVLIAQKELMRRQNGE